MSQTSLNRPQPREGPHVQYKDESGSNPILRGYLLAIISSMYAWDLFLPVFFPS